MLIKYSETKHTEGLVSIGLLFHLDKKWYKMDGQIVRCVNE